MYGSAQPLSADACDPGHPVSTSLRRLRPSPSALFDSVPQKSLASLNPLCPASPKPPPSLLLILLTPPSQAKAVFAASSDGPLPPSACSSRP